jgi:hypothetical protein
MPLSSDAFQVVLELARIYDLILIIGFATIAAIALS